MFYIDGMTNVELGVVAEEEDFFSRAALNYEEIPIDGKDGSIFVEKNYMNVSASLTLYLINKTKLDLAKSYFLGTRTLRCKEKETTIRFYDTNEIKRFGTTKALSTNYIRDPFWYKAYDPYIKVTDTILNEGNIYANPIIKLKGTGTVDISINDIRFKYTFDEDKEVVIDCKNMTETLDGKSKSKNIEIGFTYPKLSVGVNHVVIHSGNADIYIKRKDAWL